MILSEVSGIHWESQKVSPTNNGRLEDDLYINQSDQSPARSTRSRKLETLVFNTKVMLTFKVTRGFGH